MRRYTINVGDQTYTIDVQEVAGDRFRVLVEGQEYEVTLADNEDLAEAIITPEIVLKRPSSTLPPQPTAVPRAQPVVAPTAQPPAQRPAPSSSKATITAPMPGIILSVLVAPGDEITHGQAVLTLEAMKMKNTIKASRAGRVAAVLVKPGQNVAHGDPLVRFEETEL